jgi:hypothetical protein
MPRCSLSVCPVILMWACSMSSGKEVPRWRFSMIHPKSSSMRFGYSYFTGHEVFNLWFVKHMLIIILAFTLTIQDPMMGQWELKASKYHNFWRFIKLAITASLCEGSFFYFYVESPPSTFLHHLREHSCHYEFNVHSPKVYHWYIYDYGFTCS